MPPVTARAETHPQFPVPPVTAREKACEDNCLSYLPWRDFGPPIVLLLLRTNKPMRMDFLSIFLVDFRGPERRFFVLKSRARKVQVIMARCRPNPQTSRVLFHSLNGQITSLALKMERKNIKWCFVGLRMEDQRERSPQTFLVNNFSFLQPWWKQDDQCTFMWVLNTDRGFKAAPWTLENKNANVQC